MAGSEGFQRRLAEGHQAHALVAGILPQHGVVSLADGYQLMEEYFVLGDGQI